jgi:hypothetical protein
MIRHLFFILFIFLFCSANASFSEDGERIKYIGDRITSETNHSRLVRDEAKEGKSILIRLGREHFDPLRRSPVLKAPLPALSYLVLRMEINWQGIQGLVSAEKMASLPNLKKMAGQELSLSILKTVLRLLH